MNESREQRLRILHTVNDVGSSGSGIVNTAVDLAIEQARQGHSVAIASSVGNYANYRPLLERHGVRHIVLKNQPLRLKHALTSLFDMGKILFDVRPDIVHAHMRSGVILAWPWAKLLRLSLIAHAHNIHERKTLIMGLADRVIAVSHSVAETLERQGLARNKLRVALNRTLGTTRLPALGEINTMILRRPSIVTVGGMIPRKGIAELIDAFTLAAAQYPQAHLYLVGDSTERAQFEERARASGVGDRIHFEGFSSVPQAYLLAADIFVLASRRDSFALVLLEARQAGCAIVASDVDGIPEALDNGRAGVLVPPGDAVALGAALTRLLGDDAARQSLRERAVIGTEAFNVSAFVRDIDAIYRELRPPSGRSAVSTRSALRTGKASPR